MAEEPIRLAHRELQHSASTQRERDEAVDIVLEEHLQHNCAVAVGEIVDQRS
jgi:hypothetical protein